MPIYGRDLRLLRPRDAEALLDEDAFEREEFMPYWAELWPSSLALAPRDRGPGAARRAHAGARLRLSGCRASPRRSRAGGACHRLVRRGDRHDRDQRRAQRRRAETLVCSWTEPDPLLARRAVGPSIVSPPDVLYEAPQRRRAARPLPRRGPGRCLAGRPRPPAGRAPPGQAAASDWRIRYRRFQAHGDRGARRPSTGSAGRASPRRERMEAGARPKAEPRARRSPGRRAPRRGADERGVGDGRSTGFQRNGGGAAPGGRGGREEGKRRRAGRPPSNGRTLAESSGDRRRAPCAESVGRGERGLS